MLGINGWGKSGKAKRSTTGNGTATTQPNRWPRNWPTQARLVAETDRELHYKHRKAHQTWTVRQTAERLRLPISTVSMCRKVVDGFEKHPQLGDYPTLRKAYDALLELRKDV